jgi:hypothetical protein
MSNNKSDLARMKLLAGMLTETPVVKLTLHHMDSPTYASPKEALADVKSMQTMIEECQALINSKALAAFAKGVDTKNDSNTLANAFKDVNKALNTIEELSAGIFEEMTS